jgi:hypothetical protein
MGKTKKSKAFTNRKVSPFKNRKVSPFKKSLKRAIANYKRYKSQRNRIGQVMKPSLKYNMHREMMQGANTLASMRNASASPELIEMYSARYGDLNSSPSSIDSSSSSSENTKY